MTTGEVLNLAQNAVIVIIQLAGPVLIISLVVGVILSIVQAATQISEPTLTFIPKIIVAGIVLLLLGPWMLQQMILYTTNLFNSLPSLIH